MSDDPLNVYLRDVLPRVPAEARASLAAYPNARLGHPGGFTPLAACNALMLVGLTGTGKTTAQRALCNSGLLAYTSGIPSRRELADLVLIPYAQHILGESITPVRDRTARFAYTRAFRERVAPGGTAAAFGWLSYADPSERVLSEGVRGANEIGHTLTYTRWKIVELWVDPLTRLRRLSDRNEAFDRVAGVDAADLSFLPRVRHDEVRAAIAAGEITPKAVTTVRAESLNYGASPYDPANTTANYRCVHIDGMTPNAVAEAIAVAAQAMEA